MKLLIVTQKVDKNDPVLGFFHRWIEEFAKHCDHVTVIALSTGQHSLPSNVRIESLGKEKGTTRLSQIMKFWALQRELKGSYDAALIHMTPVWVVLGWLQWSAPTYLWYEAKGGGMMLSLALKKVRSVFSASAQGLPLSSPKHIVTGHGIDTDRFRISDHKRDPYALLTVGRITMSKRLDVLLDCLSASDPQMTLRIVGGPITAEDEKTLESLKNDIGKKALSKRVIIGSLPNTSVVPLLEQAAAFLHASNTGLDKAVLEAMASGCLVVSSGSAFKEILPAQCVSTDAGMADTLKRLLALPEADQNALRAALRTIVERDHSLPRLVKLLLKNMETELKA